MLNLIPTPWKITLAIAGVLLLFGVGFGIGWQTRGWLEDSRDLKAAEQAIADANKIAEERLSAGRELDRNLLGIDEEGREILNELDRQNIPDDPACVYSPDTTRLLNDARGTGN